jgi:ABC-type uncharacterized transport system YnjBCD ATPase subunit
MTQPAPTDALAADTRPWRDPDARPFISIRGITKRFGAFTAVDDVSLDIFRGELFCLLGGSGCGKSTLLRMLAGFETPTEGQVLIDGQDMARVPPDKRPTNMMFQSYALFPAHDGGKERGLRPPARGQVEARGLCARGRDAEAREAGAAGEAQAAPAVRRAAAAGGAGARAHQAAEAAAARRTARRARQEAARGDAVRTHPHPGERWA